MILVELLSNVSLLLTLALLRSLYVPGNEKEPHIPAGDSTS